MKNHEHINTQNVTPEIVQNAVAKHTQPLVDRIERGGAGAEGRQDLNQRIGEITTIVANNPERVAFDIEQRAHGQINKTSIHDPEKARMVAEVIKDDMDYIAKHNKRSRFIQKLTQKRRERAELNRRIWGEFAEKEYDKDPHGATAPGVELQRMHSSGGILRYSKSQLPRRK
jgi:hypothetical protein